MTDDKFVVQFESGSRIELRPRQIARLCYDLRSWFGVIRMLAGYADYAILQIRAPNGEEGRAAVFLDGAPAWNWEFPDETAA